jgi:hypothetical protein
MSIYAMRSSRIDLLLPASRLAIVSAILRPRDEPLSEGLRPSWSLARFATMARRYFKGADRSGPQTA